MKQCPYCAKPMAEGSLHAPRGIFWLPEGRKMKSLILTPANVEKSGGFLLSEVDVFSFTAKEKPAAYYCQDCGCLITDLKSKK